MSRTIPRELHFIWVGSELPDRFSGNLERWRALHPEWVFTLWGENDLDWLRNRELYVTAPRIVPPDAIGQFRADIARYEILYRYGGFYADVDTYPLRSIDPELTGHSAWAAAEDSNWVGNTYLGAVSGHPVFEELISELPNSAKRGVSRPNRISGPKYLTPIWWKHGCHVADRERFYPYLYSDVRDGSVPDTFDDQVVCVHEWDHTSRRVRK